MKIYQLTIIWLAALFIFGCGTSNSASSPTETIKIFVEATMAKDTKKIQSTLSKNTLEAMQKNAAAQNTTGDELLSRDVGPPITKVPEMRDEKIEGDTATLEVKNDATGKFERFPFVKEDGVWKLALDKYPAEVMKQREEEFREIQANNNVNIAIGNQSNTAVNQPAANANK